MMQACRPALEPTDHDQVREDARFAAIRMALGAAAIGGEALMRPGDHRLVGGVGRRLAAGRWFGGWRVGRHADAYLAPSLAAASRKVLTSAVAFFRPSSFSPWRLTQIVGTFIFSTGAMSDS